MQNPLCALSFYGFEMLKKKVRVQLILTKTGNELLELLQDNGWEIISQYGMFDKGIDYDWYRLKSDQGTIRMEWDNYMEWEVKTIQEILEYIR